MEPREADDGSQVKQKKTGKQSNTDAAAIIENRARE
jgi:hypothetical protein